MLHISKILNSKLKESPVGPNHKGGTSRWISTDGCHGISGHVNGVEPLLDHEMLWLTAKSGRSKYVFRSAVRNLWSAAMCLVVRKQAVT